jgi:hypothetical protein
MNMSEIARGKESRGRAVNQELMLIDGKWMASADGRFFAVENPLGGIA